MSPLIRYSGFIAPLLILAAVFLVYSNTLHGQFLLDERVYLLENPFVTEADATLRSLPPGGELYKSVVQRYIGYLTFTLNHRLHGFQVEGYHIVNVTIHFLNSLLVYFVVLLTFRAPRLADSALHGHAGITAFMTAMLFAVHPVHTEAVTYVMQRFASLAAFFSLVALLCYIQWRLAGGDGGRDQRRIWWYAGSLLSCVLAMKTKENTLLLPIAIVLYEAIIFRGDARRRVIGLLPILTTMLIIPLTAVFLARDGAGMPISEMAAGGSATVPWRTYLITQVRALITYYRLLIAPVRQNFLYNYPIYDSFGHPEVVLSAILHACVISGGVFILARPHRFDPALRTISFGIFWFYLMLFVESGMIPLPIMLCEYRLYLPSVGFFLATMTAVQLVFVKVRSRSVLLAGAVVILVLLLAAAAVAYRRNALLSDHVALWEDTVRKSPNSAKAHTNLGTMYLEQDRLDEALDQFQTVLRIDPGGYRSRRNIIITYVRQGRFEDAADEFRKTLSDGVDAVQAHKRLGDLYMENGAIKQASEEYQIALRQEPNNIEIRYDLGNAFAQLGSREGAIAAYQEVIRQVPGHSEARNNLAGVYAQLGRYDDALRELQHVLDRNPKDENTRYNVKIVLEQLEQDRGHATDR
ncbi:MAG: tetratricopeptide repeat protein [Nitrospirota bacterium]|nr:tetratricopeptide repeat protein [Nitrospirota bacterium]